MVHRDEVVVCEGYTDVIGFVRAGIPRAVATCGTALTEDHVKLLKRFTNRIVLAYDADEAGQTRGRAGLRVGADARDRGRGRRPARRRRSRRAVRAPIPSALRPRSPRRRPFLGFRVDRVLAAADLAHARRPGPAADAALEVVAEHPDDARARPVRDARRRRVSTSDAERAADPAARTIRAVAARPADAGTVPGVGTTRWSDEPAPDEHLASGSDDGVAPPAARTTARSGEALRLVLHRRDEIAEPASVPVAVRAPDRPGGAVRALRSHRGWLDARRRRAARGAASC